MDARAQSQRIREHVWHGLESESGDLEKVLADVQALAAVGSFATARKRFGHFRLTHERRLRSVQRLESLLEGSRGTAAFFARLERERARVLQQSDRVWTQLCRQRTAQLPRMLARLTASITRHEQTLRRQILGEPPLTAVQLGAAETLAWRPEET